MPRSPTHSPGRTSNSSCRSRSIGLRADLLNRYQASFSKDGFQYLLQQGTVYTNAQYLHANTETIVGHMTLATGAFPSQHGMIGNVWFDREAGELAYNIEDADAPLVIANISSRCTSLNGAHPTWSFSLI